MSQHSIGFLLLVLTAPGLAGQQPLPPAPVGTHVDTWHGIRVPDPYRWMEDLEAPATRAWVRAQDQATQAYVGDVADRAGIRETITRAAMARRFSTPVRFGDGLLYQSFRTQGGTLQSEGIWLQPDRGGAPRLLMDGAPLAAREERLSIVAPTRDGRFLAYGVGPRSSRWATLRIRDVRTGTDREEALTGLLATSSSVQWLPDNSGFYYTDFSTAGDGDRRTAQLGDHRVRFHRLGTAQGEDPVLFTPPPGAGWRLRAVLTMDGRTLVVEAKEPASPGNRVYLLDLADPGTPETLVESFAATFTFLGHGGDVLWFQTDADAKRGRIVAIDRRHPARDRWTDLIPEQEDPITNWAGATVVGGHVLVNYLVDARHTVRVFDTTGRHRYDLALPRPMGSLWTGFVGRQDETEAFYTLSGTADPGTVYRLEVGTGRSTVFRAPEAGYDPDRYLTQQAFYTARDGTRIPMFLVHRRDLDRSRPAPVFMYGYAFDWAAAPWFQPQMVAWMERGGIWALPNTRGGTEYGEDWNAAGSLLRKQTAIYDYIDATEWLIAQRVTTRRLMVANASSAGGAIAGAALVQRPDLYGAAVLDYPLLDMLRYDQFTGARVWTHEYGTTADSAQFRALLAYSPYHTIRPGVCYPPTFVAPGERDEVTPPLHAYKFVARLQAAQTCPDQRISLRVAWGAGHAAGASTEDAIARWTDQLAFLQKVLGTSAADGGN